MRSSLICEKKSMRGRKRLNIKGIVQGVGFRPFVYRIAHDLHLAGFVRNTTDGVEIEIEGEDGRLGRFIEKLSRESPPAARIDAITSEDAACRGDSSFSIIDSRISAGFTQISPDIATCADCLNEMRDRDDRRHSFPFINCTNCGPRYSIIKDTPYDRPRTSMRAFKMCRDCSREFKDVTDRRFHAQPDCCKVCGPQFRLFAVTGKKIAGKDPIQQAVDLLLRGKIVAIKGIGGFHIACDAQNCTVVAMLRKLKNRPTKPLAIMVRPDRVEDIAHLTQEERKILASPAAPIVLLKKKRNTVCDNVAPLNPYLGIMLPYAPVHHLLLEQIPYLVMTSANVQDEPIVISASEVRERLGAIVSFYLDHDRAIENRCDDSIGYFMERNGFSLIRRSRGYAPVPVEMPIRVRPTLAVGPFLKNTFTLARDADAYVSPHIGDLDNLETLRFFNEMIEKYKRWFRIDPELICHDLHPDYLSTKIARDMTGKKKGVQHHIAHFVSCLAENRAFGKSIGIIFDGTGYGLDQRIWGGEFFIGDMATQQRAAHLEYLPLPGAESSIKKPYRIAVAYVYALLKRDARIAPAEEVKVIHKLIDENRNIAFTSSMGRLFDCISALLGITREITYEAEAAINLEHIADQGAAGPYPYAITDAEPAVIRIKDMVEAIQNDIENGVSPAMISARFHRTVVEFSYDVCERIRKEHGTETVALSGGVFQNRFLLTLMIERLEKGGFSVLTHRQLPTNDGCISYGQAVCVNATSEERI